MFFIVRVVEGRRDEFPLALALLQPLRLAWISSSSSGGVDAGVTSSNLYRYDGKRLLEKVGISMLRFVVVVVSRFVNMLCDLVYWLYSYDFQVKYSSIVALFLEKDLCLEKRRAHFEIKGRDCKCEKMRVRQ